MKLLKSLKGFTMIELLIVIAVLGILAVAVLAAINPIEQINRGRDTGSRSDSEQLLSAIDRFYTTQNYYPWQASNTSAAAINVLTNVTTSWNDTNSASVLNKLTTGGTQELKQSFVSRITGTGYNSLGIYFRGSTGDSFYICFRPQSGAFAQEATDRCAGTKSSIPADLSPINATVCPTVNKLICLP